MSRAIRRQQAAGPKPTETPSRAPKLGGLRRPQQTRGARPPAPQKKRFAVRAPNWAADIASELKKVSWPTRDETIYLTTVVIVVSLIVGLMLGSIDIFFNWLIDHLLLR